MSGLKLAKKGANTDFGKTVINDAISLLPNAYKSIKNKVFGRKKKKLMLQQNHYQTPMLSPSGQHYN